MKINQLSKISGFSASTLYDYLRSGLLHPPVKTGPTKSSFNQTHIERLEKIRKLKKNNKLSLSDIKQKFSDHENPVSGKNASARDARIQIIDKALELFSKYHYENTKISDITAELDMGSGTFYKYFKNKEELFLDCLDRLPEVLVPDEAWKQVKYEKDYIQRLKKRGYAMLNAFPSYIAILNYAKLALGSDNKNLSIKAADCIKKLVNPLKKELESAVSEGSVRAVNEDLIAYLLLGINETFFHRMLIDKTYTIEEGFSIIEDFISHALIKREGIQPETDHGAAEFLVTDHEGNGIRVRRIMFNQAEYLSGNYLKGRLQIPGINILSITFKLREGDLEARVKGRNRMDIELSMDADITLSGETGFGTFLVPLSKVSSVARVFPE